MTSLEKAEHIVANKNCVGLSCVDCPGHVPCDMYPSNCNPLPEAVIDSCKQFIEKEHVMDKSRLTIQRPEGCPEWAEIGVLMMVRDNNISPWEGPYPLLGYDPDLIYVFCVRKDEASCGYRHAKPYTKWQPEPGEWVAFGSSSSGLATIGLYDGMNGNLYEIKCYGLVDHVARLVDDEDNLIDLRCTVEELKERTEWL